MMRRFTCFIETLGEKMEKKSACEDRRGALSKMITVMGMCACGAASPLFIPGCESTSMKSTGQGEEFDVGSVAELDQVGGAVKHIFGNNNDGRPVLIIRKAVNSFLALSTTCTHQGCEVNIPESSGSSIHCPCHGSQFSSTDGSVVQGPAPSPLRRFTTSYYAPTKKLTITF
jgi:Rieske Fe-S protein